MDAQFSGFERHFFSLSGATPLCEPWAPNSPSLVPSSTKLSLLKLRGLAEHHPVILILVLLGDG
jgi:hypothetical protein